MTRLMTASATLAALLAGACLASAPAAAQDDPGDKVNQVIVYGDDPCPASNGDEITVCARKPEGERYRIPAPLRGVDSPTAQSWSNKVDAYETVGAFGTLSCSPVGAGGSQGCTQQLLDKAAAERANGTDVKMSELIAEERAKRLSTIDSEAAEQQRRVEEAEEAYFAQQRRQQAERDAAEKGDDTTGGPQQP
ncbi:hypothetical protein I5E68_00830 [Novosphingobium sp. YJ-S2-02]|uniref:DUF4124 domain-containing protein n=1 Tax=Novosphingobium aureum TaxID=2792964 RepID=A0A931H9L8_9SPHN|nr:hypothetical protein [Novosphingobium aureum]MBH0111494.1 hypothetical protein [Novosphingobium aureum]